jgi:hypothetical protein
MYDSKNTDQAQALLSEFSYLAGNRGNWESHWQEIAERFLPAYSNSFNSLSQGRTQGEKRTEQIFDSTASIALGRFASILDSLLTPRNSQWHRLTASDPNLSKNREVRLWFEEVSRLLFKYRYAPMANFASQNQQNYEGLGAFGTGCMLIDELDKGVGMRYRAIHLGEVYFRENHQGIIDSAYRYFPMTARQAHQKWGSKVEECLKSKLASNPDQNCLFLHVVKPREDYDPQRLDYKGMELASHYVSVEGKVHLSEGGYNTFPYAISRYKQAPGETYGRSPAMDVLPAVKTLNEEKKTVLKQGHRAVDPVLLVHDDGIIDTFSLRPGALNAGGMSADGRPLVGTLPVGNINIGKDLMDDERSVINDAFLVTIFQVLTETPAMTATEVLERTREKGILLAPTLGRQQSEYLGPMIEREVDILSRQGLLPPMPEILKEAQGEYTVTYDSPLSRAAKAEEASGLMRSVETALQIVNVSGDREPLDHFNWDVIIPEVSSIQGVPEKWMRSLEDIQAIREGRAQAAEQQQQIQAAPAAAAMMKASAAVQKV